MARRGAGRLAGVACALLLAVGVLGCTPTDEDSRSATQGLPDVVQRLRAHEWRLDGAASSVKVVAPGTTLVFDSAHVLWGRAPCNTYRGRVHVDGTSLQVTRVLATSLPCDAPTMAAERAYFAALEQVRESDTTDPDRLVLTGDGGVELAYQAQSRRADLVGRWRIVGIERADELAPVVAGSRLVATFRGDGTLVVEGSCNVLSSSWTLDGPDITIDEPRSTRKLCDEPAGVMEQEAALSAALTRSVVVDLSSAELTLLDEDGDSVLVGRPAVGGP